MFLSGFIHDSQNLESVQVSFHRWIVVHPYHVVVCSNEKEWTPDTHTVCSRAQSREALWDPMDCSPPWSSVHGIFQARFLKWVAFYFSRWSSRPRNWTWISCISCIGRRILYHYTTWKAQYTQQPEWILRGLPSGKSWPQSFHSVWFHYITFHLKLIKLKQWRTESRRRWGGERGDEVGRKQLRSKPHGGDVLCLYPVVIFCLSFSRCYHWRKLAEISVLFLIMACETSPFFKKKSI